ncbi:hypothetical protein [Alistipes sp. ZOR0009]|uniref:hypothetical protein n=1 Tax=Alistipes sp. ZOR0009 TaxID=1339253 RepID=UPI0006462B0A|nr:hypothetical protein [Alistipes sp. ZOR0009]
MNESNTLFYRLLTGLNKYVKGNDVLMGIPAIEAATSKIDLIISKIDKTAVLVDTENKGVYIAVEVATKRVVAPLFAVVKSMELYYGSQNDAAKMAELHTTRSEIQRMPYKMLDATVKTILKFASANLAILGTYGITAATLKEIEDGMKQLQLANTVLEAYLEEKSQNRAVLSALVEDGKKILVECDMLVEIISLTHPAIYKGYMEIRSKKEYSERLLTITVLNSETRKPEENARVVMVSTTRTVKGEPYVLLDRKTGKLGEVRNSRREFDIYKLTVEKVGCDLQEEIVTVADNTPLRLVVLLKKKQVSS